MRYFLGLAAIAVLAGCQTSVPDSGAGVGFGDYDTYQQQRAAREAQLGGQTPVVPPAPNITGAPLSATGSAGTPPPAQGTELARDTQAVLAATRANSGQKPLDASPSNPPPPTVSNPAGISNENDFNAVGAQRSIKADAALRAQQQAQYQQIQPTAVPTRTGSTGPSIVEYALNTTHPRGTNKYRRTGMNLQAKYERNCAKYPSPDLAQSEFLAKGGPQKDRLGLDPDGDGYACTWDPSPFRAAKNG
ncbi:hypothetical protein N4R57_18565 [Rhodobacteraceae bacterium D3-12]|nr:hypothetical protein N4R57_18565 [Rhodobacteraceae bacterium D3-12]